MPFIDVSTELLSLTSEASGHLFNERLLDLQEVEYYLLKLRTTHTGITQILCKYLRRCALYFLRLMKVYKDNFFFVPIVVVLINFVHNGRHCRRVGLNIQLTNMKTYFFVL